MTPGKFAGVYSSPTPGRRGTIAEKRYWFVWDCGDDGYHVQALDRAFQVQGEPLAVDAVAFAAGFSPEPTILAVPLSRRDPFVREEDGKERKTPESPQDEVENRMRTDFAALLMKARRGDDLPATVKALADMARTEEGIAPEHKFMFAEFGANLRKGKLPEAALEHAKRVLALAPDDSHAHFNIARIYYAMDKTAEAEQHLRTALEFSPDLEYAKNFLLYIEKQRKLKKIGSGRASGPLNERLELI